MALLFVSKFKLTQSRRASLVVSGVKCRDLQAHEKPTCFVECEAKKMGLERSVESKCLDDRQFEELKLYYRNCITNRTRIKTDLSNEFLPEGNFVHSYTSAS